MHTLTGTEIQENVFDVELLAAGRAAAAGHVHRESCPYSHINEHEGLDILAVIQQEPDGDYVDRQCPHTDNEPGASSKHLDQGRSMIEATSAFRRDERIVVVRMIVLVFHCANTVEQLAP